MSSKLTIIRGPSGSGKSTIAKHLGGVAEVNWFEADMYMLTKDGEYKWSVDKLLHAHKWCQDMLRKAIQQGWEDVIVSDTSTRLSEAQLYIDLAVELGVEYEVIRTPGPWNIDDLAARNEHNVPRATLEKHVARYVAVQGEREWNDLSIFNGVK